MNSRNSRLQIKFRIRKAFVVRMLMLAVLPALLLSACAFSDVSDLPTLYDVLGDRKTRSVIPEENEGLLINLSDTLLTKTMMYLDALMDQQQTYTDYSRLPSTSDLSAPVLERLEEIWKMGGTEQVSYLPDDNDTFVRARWFAEGRGRAYIGYAEAMNAMGQYADDVVIRRFSYAAGRDIPLFYTDVVGIRSDIGGEKKELAFELANLLISEEVLTRMSLSGEAGGTLQYLLTSRRSVYDALCWEYPIYGHLKEMVDSPDNHVFRLGDHAREFISRMEAALCEELAQTVGYGENH
ncbi:MAG: thiamine pyridinylase [Clostridia bacterium]|nr:thiamine pyridinylase [Clostridia bacterium]